MVNTQYDDNNIFAKILRKEIPCKLVYEDDYVLSFHDIQPQAAIHVLIIPKGRYVSFHEFHATASEQEITGFYRAVSMIAETLKLPESGYRLLSNHGKDARQEVPHAHLHMIGGQDLGGMLPRRNR